MKKNEKLKPKINLCVFIFILFSTFSYSQILKGVIQDENNNLLNAKLLIKKVSTPNLISEFYIVKAGVYSYKLKNTYTEDIIIEVSSIGYVTRSEILSVKNSTDTFERDFNLLKEEITNLEEVFITGKKASYKIKNDTIVYNVNSYKDGSERKIEDLLKKLPGIEVNDKSGLIKYNGKLIETVTLEGDDLFGYNYTLGTKNINIDMVEEIEAIENYSNNALLKGLEQDGKVALNLKLKKNKTDISGNADLGIGYFEDDKKTAKNSSLNLLGINKFYKSFATLSFNNIGLNHSSFSYSNNSSNLEALKEFDYMSQKIIPEANILTVINEERTNINNQLFSNFNSFFNFSKKLKAKVNLYFIKDKIQSNQAYISDFNIENTTFKTFDNTFLNKKPIQYRGDLELNYFNSKSSLLKYRTSFRDEKINTESSIFSNQNSDFKSSLKSGNRFLKQQIEYTNRISDKKALQIVGHFSSNIISQNQTLNPSFLNPDNSSLDSQKINQKKVFFDLKTILLGSSKKNKYNFNFGSLIINEPLKSSLFSFSDGNIFFYDSGINELRYTKKSLYTHGSYDFKIGKIRLSPSYSIRLIKQSLSNSITNNEENSNLLVFEPTLNLFYKINSVSFLSANLGLNKNTNQVQNLFQNNILINNRSLINNSPSISLQSNETYSISYNKNDLFNQSQLTFGASYLKQKGNFFSNSLITLNSNTINNFFLPENTENINFNFSYSKFLSFLNTNIKLNSMYSIYNYKNIVNNSGIRSNNTNQISNQLFFKTSFNIKVNFENEVDYSYNKTINDFKFSNSSFRNSFKMIYKTTKEVYTILSKDLFVPNLKNKSEIYNFIDMEIRYKPDNKNWLLSFAASNITNENTFSQIQNTDISQNTFNSNLLSRYFLLKFNHNF